jgi:hypothetical protein
MKHVKKIYRNKFVYAAKPALGTPGAEGYHAARFKARLVCTAWDEDIAGKDTYAPVIRHDTLRAFLSTCAADNHSLRCLDIFNAFLLSELEEPMYMELPPGKRFDECRKNDEVCVLRKGIYGLRTSPLRFFRHLNKFLLSERYGLVQCASDPCLYRHKTKELWLALYVDDTLIKGAPAAVAELEGLLNEDFKCRSYGEPKAFLGMDIDRDHKAGTIHIS